MPLSPKLDDAEAKSRAAKLTKWAMRDGKLRREFAFKDFVGAFGFMSSVALLAVVSMPLSIAALNHVYAGHASVAPWDVARQVFVAQLLPLGLGMALRQVAAALAARLESRLAWIGNALLVATVVLVLINGWEGTITAGFRVMAAVALITGGALAVGHLLGGPEPATRTAVAITSAARNPGLALLVAAVNAAQPGVNAAILAYLVVSVLVVVPYVAWCRRTGARSAHAG